MSEQIRAFIESLGGYRAVAARLGKGATTLHGYIQQGALPAKFYDALCRLAAEAQVECPPRTFFLFDSLIEDGEAA